MHTVLSSCMESDDLLVSAALTLAATALLELGVWAEDWPRANLEEEAPR